MPTPASSEPFHDRYRGPGNSLLRVLSLPSARRTAEGLVESRSETAPASRRAARLLDSSMQICEMVPLDRDHTGGSSDYRVCVAGSGA